MLQTLFPGSIDKMAKDRGYFPGSPPMIVEEHSDLLQLLVGDDDEQSQIEFGAHQVAIVRNQNAKQYAKKLGFTLVLTVLEAKGLEFDGKFDIDL